VSYYVLVGTKSPITRLSSVDLPTPFGPTMAARVSISMPNDTSLNSHGARSLYRKNTLSSVSKGGDSSGGEDCCSVKLTTYSRGRTICQHIQTIKTYTAGSRKGANYPAETAWRTSVHRNARTIALTTLQTREYAQWHASCLHATSKGNYSKLIGHCDNSVRKVDWHYCAQVTPAASTWRAHVLTFAAAPVL
jgi:hypothetical protein